MSFKAVLFAGSTSLLLSLAVGVSTVPAGAQYCEGTVHGLSRHYNFAKGTGFLAVRARPTASSRMVAQLFNGDQVEITDRRGNWYFVGGSGFEGWAHRKWMWNSCNF